MERKRHTTVSQGSFEAGPSERRIISVMESEADSDTASHSSSTSLPGGEYEVFLSFRGPDTRLTFTDFLYTSLDSGGVRTFRDDNELRKGKEIGPELLKAIAESRISIPIFSKNFGSSKWCLRELAKMVECKRSSGQLILPIFYDVEPSEVRHQSGCYEEAFREHESFFHESTVKEWKEAMREVGTLKGWEVKKEANGYQGELIKRIFQTVLLELKKNYMILIDNLVGMDDHIYEMMRLLKVGSSGAQIVGIYGMGGIGKTTIAKCIYNKLLKNFECCSFLADIRETAQQHKSLVPLQKQLLGDTLKCSPDIADVNSGIAAIKDRLLKKKVLVILDDVSEKSQVDSLVGNCNWFGPGSLIIVTTRDKHILNMLEVDDTYEPPYMNIEQSLQLFSIHAFRKKFPPTDYDSISREIVLTTGGLPLALQVIGSFLSDKMKVDWKATLKKLKKIPDDQVKKKLRISYDELNREQKQIFLDIACLFIGMDKTYPFYMWNDCCYYPEKEITVLCLMSLVRMENDNVLKMHDQLRDLGREMIRQEDVTNPGARSRLWNEEEATDVVEEQKGTEKVEVLSLPDSRKMSESCFTSKTFKKLSNLRYLRANGAEFVGDFKYRLSELRWFCWKNCPSHFEAINFRMKNLVILDLSGASHIREDWKGWSQIKMSNKLKVLDLANCGLRRSPDFSTYAALEILNLKGCKSLYKIDPSIGTVKNLKVVDISYTKIRRLPDEIWMLEELEVLDASCRTNLEGNIPSCIGRLSSLRHLSFHSTKIQSLPTSICELSYLQILELQNCYDLQELPELPSSLEILNLFAFDKDRYLPVTLNLANLVNLQELQFSRCNTNLTTVEKLSKLQVLKLSHLNIKTLREGIGALSRLKRLDIHSCDDLQYILGLPSSLAQVSLEYCESLERLPDLSNSKKLLELTLTKCHKLVVIQGLEKLESLTKLKISWCDMLEAVHGLGNQESLEDLRIKNCNKITKVDLLEHLASLPSSSSEIREYKHFEEKSAQTNLNALIALDLTGCTSLNIIQALDRMESLRNLILSECTSIVRLPNLSNLKMLGTLLVYKCTSLRKIEGLAWESLLFLDVRGCTSLEGGVPHLPDATVLTIDGKTLLGENVKVFHSKTLLGEHIEVCQVQGPGMIKNHGSRAWNMIFDLLRILAKWHWSLYLFWILGIWLWSLRKRWTEN